MAMAMAMIPPGYHFVPSDEELISVFLSKASMGLPMPSIRELSQRDLYGDKVDPWDVLSDVCWDIDHDHVDSSKSKHRVTYVLTTLSRADGKGRAARRTRTGTWKGQTSGTAIRDESGELIGLKKMFTFMPDRKEKRSNDDRWIMHEYSLAGNYDHRRLKNKGVVLCRIKHIFKDDFNSNYKRRLAEEEEEEELGFDHVHKMQKQEMALINSDPDDDDDTMSFWKELAELTSCSSSDLEGLGVALEAPQEEKFPIPMQFPKRFGI